MNPCTRRQFLATAALALSQAAGPEKEPEAALFAPARPAAERGLAYLASAQGREGALAGSWAQGQVAITALAALAFLAGGHQPGQGPHGETLERAVRYLLRRADGRGLLDSPEAAPRGTMYNHAFAALFLAEVHGTIADRALAGQLSAGLRRAIRLILDTQNAEGGWRYEAIPVEEADLSVTAAQVMALRAARNVGVAVPRAATERCREFLTRCQVLPDGGFRYKPGQGGVTFPLTAAGLVGLHCLGVYDGPAVEAARQYLRGYLPTRRPRPAVPAEYYLYGHYYAVQALRQQGGAAWREWYAAVRDELSPKDGPAEPPAPARQPDGSWADARFGPHYATALACLILQRPLNYLPVFQH
jgi:hypothetical protein